MRKAVLLGLIMFGFSKAHALPLSVGQPAPDFTAESTSGTIRLSAWLDRAPIVLYFYPKDNTPGCTKEACSLRDDFAAFRQLKATVFGVSYDSLESHNKFIAEHRLPFPLIADTHHTIAKAYGADGIFFAKRMTFIIDRQGRIAWLNPSVNPATHSQELQAALRPLLAK